MELKGKQYYDAPWKFVIAFPYCVYIILVNKFHKAVSQFMVFFRNIPLRGLGDMLYKAPLYNIRGNQHACLGSTLGVNIRDPVLSIEKAISHFWNTSYNEDFLSNISAYQQTEIVNNYFTWQYYSKVNPMVIFEIPWIPYKSLKEVINDMEKNIDKNQSKSIKMEDITKLFSDVSQDLSDVERGPQNVDRQKLFYGVANYIDIDGDGTPIYCEDSFTLKKKQYSIITFVSNCEETFKVTHLQVLNYKGENQLIKLTSGVRNKIKESIQKEKVILTQNIDGIDIKADDIIQIVHPGGSTRFKKIRKIRYNLDGKVEVLLGNEYYLLERIKILNKLDLSKPTLYGEELTKNEIYIYLTKYSHTKRSMVLSTYLCVKYLSTDITSLGEVNHYFRDKDNDDYNYTISSSNQKVYNIKKLYKKNELISVPNFFRVGNTISKTKPEDVLHPVYEIKNEMMLVNKHNEISYGTISKSEIIDNCFSNDRKIFSLYGIDGVINFSVGDKVITPDWSRNPMEMLKIKTITGFDFSQDNTCIYAILQDKNKNESFVKFIENISYAGQKIHISSMYRILNEYGVLQTGMKIKAKVPRIQNFPLSDVNIIIGIFRDMQTPDPLVLCSNGCTLWYSDIIEKFNIFTINDLKWNKMNHEPFIMSKIKPQIGDFYVSVNTPINPFVLCKNFHERNSLTCVYYKELFSTIEQIPNFSFTQSIRKHSTPYGVLTPRYSQSQLMDMSLIPGFPSPFLNITYNERSKLSFKDDPRRTRRNV